MICSHKMRLNIIECTWRMMTQAVSWQNQSRDRDYVLNGFVSLLKVMEGSYWLAVWWWDCAYCFPSNFPFLTEQIHYLILRSMQTNSREKSNIYLNTIRYTFRSEVEIQMKIYFQFSSIIFLIFFTFFFLPKFVFFGWRTLKMLSVSE